MLEPHSGEDIGELGHRDIVAVGAGPAVSRGGTLIYSGPNALGYSQEQGDDLVGVRVHEGLDGLEVFCQRALVQLDAAGMAHLDGAI